MSKLLSRCMHLFGGGFGRECSAALLNDASGLCGSCVCRLESNVATLGFLPLGTRTWWKDGLVLYRCLAVLVVAIIMSVGIL